MSEKVGGYMAKNPVTVKVTDDIKDAIDKMKKGDFRHLPVVDNEGRLLGMLSDRDIRLIRPSVAIDSDEKAAFRIRPIAVQKAMVFFPVTVRPEDSLERAAELMLRWKVGGLPVASDGDTLVGIITYTDLLRAFVAKKKAGAIA